MTAAEVKEASELISQLNKLNNWVVGLRSMPNLPDREILLSYPYNSSGPNNATLPALDAIEAVEAQAKKYRERLNFLGVRL